MPGPEHDHDDAAEGKKEGQQLGPGEGLLQDEAGEAHGEDGPEVVDNAGDLGVQIGDTLIVEGRVEKVPGEAQQTQTAQVLRCVLSQFLPLSLDQNHRQQGQGGKDGGTAEDLHVGGVGQQDLAHRGGGTPQEDGDARHGEFFSHVNTSTALYSDRGRKERGGDKFLLSGFLFGGGVVSCRYEKIQEEIL